MYNHRYLQSSWLWKVNDLGSPKLESHPAAGQQAAEGLVVCRRRLAGGQLAARPAWPKSASRGLQTSPPFSKTRMTVFVVW